MSHSNKVLHEHRADALERGIWFWEHPDEKPLQVKGVRRLRDQPRILVVRFEDNDRDWAGGRFWDDCPIWLETP
jgi:hypothetical protein